MTKGSDTRRTILHHAVNLSSEMGLEGLTIGVLARKAGMSKSGLYAHFGSKEDLQCAVLDSAAERFVDMVVAPALKQPRGLPRLEMLFERWLTWETDGLSGGCPFIAASHEFDDRSGPVRDRLVSHLRDLLGAITRAAQISVEEGHLREDLDVEQFAYEMWAALLAYHSFARLMRTSDAIARARRAFANLIRNARA